MYPNPAKDLVNYIIISPEKKEVLLQLLDISGRILVAKKVSVINGANSFQLDVSKYESGNYRMSIVDIDEKNRIGKSIIIVR